MRASFYLLVLYMMPCAVFAASGQTAPQPTDAYVTAKNELQDMLDGNAPLSYERAVFIMENAYHDDSLSYAVFQKTLDIYTQLITAIKQSNNNQLVPQKERSIFEMARQTDAQRKADYDRALTNWAIFSFISNLNCFVSTDSSVLLHFPYTYATQDPMATADWQNAQVTHLLQTGKGNCFALASLFKLFSDRLHSEASLCTAPSHIYISHKDEHGTDFNIDIASRSFPGSGTLETLTYTSSEATKNGISMRTLDDKQAVALCLVYLAKAYEYKLGRQDAFVMDCAETALRYDPLNLNALLLKAELLQHEVQQKQKTITQLQADKDFKEYEQLLNKLYTLGYREMPLDMKNILVKGWKQDTTEIYLKNYLANNKDETRKASLSWGLFDEEHKYKPIEQYGQTLFDCKTKKIKGFANEKPLYDNYTFDPVVFAWNIDPLTAKYPGESPYVFVSNSPLIHIDPDGQEKIVVTGGADMHNKQRMNFVMAAKNQLLLYRKQVLNSGSDEPVSWLILDKQYSESEKKSFSEWAKRNGVGAPIFISSADEVANYINSKSTASPNLTDVRNFDEISNLSFMSHGVPGEIALGYENTGYTYKKDDVTNFGSEEIAKLSGGAFLCGTKIDMYSCNSATPTNMQSQDYPSQDALVNSAMGGNNLVKEFSNVAKGAKVTGFIGQTSYSGVANGNLPQPATMDGSYSPTVNRAHPNTIKVTMQNGKVLPQK